MEEELSTNEGNEPYLFYPETSSKRTRRVCKLDERSKFER